MSLPSPCHRAFQIVKDSLLVFFELLALLFENFVPCFQTALFFGKCTKELLLFFHQSSAFALQAMFKRLFPQLEVDLMLPSHIGQFHVTAFQFHIHHAAPLVEFVLKFLQATLPLIVPRRSFLIQFVTG